MSKIKRSSFLIENMHLMRDSLKLHPNAIRLVGLNGAATASAIAAYYKDGIGIQTNYEISDDGFGPWNDLDLGRLSQLSGIPSGTLLVGLYDIKNLGKAMAVDKIVNEEATVVRVAFHDESFLTLVYGLD